MPATHRATHALSVGLAVAGLLATTTAVAGAKSNATTGNGGTGAASGSTSAAQASHGQPVPTTVGSTLGSLLLTPASVAAGQPTVASGTLAASGRRTTRRARDPEQAGDLGCGRHIDGRRRRLLLDPVDRHGSRHLRDAGRQRRPGFGSRLDQHATVDARDPEVGDRHVVWAGPLRSSHRVWRAADPLHRRASRTANCRAAPR